jgi:dTDP-glucose 4,6-dehydratase
MRILITGSEGVLGSTLKKELRFRGHQVFGCDLQHSSDANVMRADVAENRQIDRVFSWALPDIVYHFAAEFGRKNGQDYYEQLWKTNCIGTRNVIDLCTETKSKLIFASSSEAYGMADRYLPEDRPLEERDLDKYPPQFHNEYALTKYTNERQITMAVRNQDLDAIILRFFNVYGPPEKYNSYRSVVCLFAYKLLKGLPITVYKNSYRTHLWIGDWANTVAGIADNQYLSFGMYWPGSAGTPWVPVFNIGGRGKESTTHMLELLQKITGIKGNITSIIEETGNVASKEPDNHAAEVHLGHNPTKDFEEGLRETVAYLKETYGL